MFANGSLIIERSLFRSKDRRTLNEDALAMSSVEPINGIRVLGPMAMRDAHLRTDLFGIRELAKHR